MRQSVLFTGPCGVGKTTIGRLTAEKLDMPFYDLDELRGRLYAGTGYSRWKAWLAARREVEAWYAYQKPYELASARRALEEYPGALIALGGGQSVYEGDMAREYLKLVKKAKVILLLPYKDRERPLALLDRWVPGKDARKLNRLFVDAPTNFQGADEIIYTGERPPEEVAEEAAALC